MYIARIFSIVSFLSIIALFGSCSLLAQPDFSPGNYSGTLAYSAKEVFGTSASTLGSGNLPWSVTISADGNIASGLADSIPLGNATLSFTPTSRTFADNTYKVSGNVGLTILAYVYSGTYTYNLSQPSADSLIMYISANLSTKVAGITDTLTITYSGTIYKL